MLAREVAYIYVMMFYAISSRGASPVGQEGVVSLGVPVKVAIKRLAQGATACMGAVLLAVIVRGVALPMAAVMSYIVRVS